MATFEVNGCKINLTNPDKLLWPNLKITKADYLKKLVELWPYLIPHTTNRVLTAIRYPDGVFAQSFFQKKLKAHTPEWIDAIPLEDERFFNLNKPETLLWLGNQATLEFHTTFNLYDEPYVSYLVFDLDPSAGQTFPQVAAAALIIYDELKKLSIKSLVKTSGASGLQIYIPIQKKYTYDQGRKLNAFFGQFFAQKYPDIFTIERSVDKRKGLLYFDYLQMWQGKSIISVYSPRAEMEATVSTPVNWEELENGISPVDFTLFNIMERLKEKGDLFEALLNEKNGQDLDFILKSLS